MADRGIEREPKSMFDMATLSAISFVPLAAFHFLYEDDPIVLVMGALTSLFWLYVTAMMLFNRSIRDEFSERCLHAASLTVVQALMLLVLVARPALHFAEGFREGIADGPLPAPTPPDTPIDRLLAEPGLTAFLAMALFYAAFFHARWRGR